MFLYKSVHELTRFSFTKIDSSDRLTTMLHERETRCERERTENKKKIN